jgi:hypothetical protein
MNEWIFYFMEFIKIKVSEHANAIINKSLLIGVFYERKSYQYDLGSEIVLRFVGGHLIVIHESIVKDVLISLGLDNV